MRDLFSEPISETKVRDGIYAYQYPNGTININGMKFIGYSVREAIKVWKSKNK